MHLQKVLPNMSMQGVGGMNRVLPTLQQPDVAVGVSGCSPRTGAGIFFCIPCTNPRNW